MPFSPVIAASLDEAETQCSACRTLRADNRRRTPHDHLELTSANVALKVPENGIVFTGMRFRCRLCGAHWLLLDAPHEPFVSWITSN